MLSATGKTASLAALLAAINALIAIRLFGIDYTRQMGSIEASWIALARYTTQHFGQFNWFPLWYGGIPYQDTYPPLLPLAVAAVAAAAHISPGLAYHVVTAAVYSLTPAALFWAAWRLGATRANAFVASLFYSVISPSSFLVPAVRTDSGGWFGPRRLIALVHYGEGPHTTSLLLLPLAIGLLHVALQKRRPLCYAGAALGFVAVALTNSIGTVALALAVASYLLAGHRQSWRRTALLACYAYAVALPWLTPSTISTIRANAPIVGGYFTGRFSYEALFAAALLLLAWVLKKSKYQSAASFGLLFFFGAAFIVLGSYWYHQALIPQPQRYHLEMDMAFWLAAALIVPRVPLAASVAAAAVLTPAIVYQYGMAQEIEQPIEIASTIEYKVSNWLGDHMPGSRVFAPGTIGFWANAFRDIPLLNGGNDNGVRNTFLQGVIYQMYASDSQESALAWLRAFGCDAVIGGDKESREVYHPIRYPAKFHGLRELWRDGADVIYEVPRRNRSLAHALFAADVVEQPTLAYYLSPIQRYLTAIDNPALPYADFRWRGPGDATITADLRRDHLIAVEVSWDQGWKARVNGEPRRIWADTLGQMVVEPRCSGPCTVVLSYDGGSEMWLARMVSGLALAGGAIWILPSSLIRKRSTIMK